MKTQNDRHGITPFKKRYNDKQNKIVLLIHRVKSVRKAKK